MQKVIGLAGHIDHGKTALVKAITGVDTDRLEEEKRRGVTIDIGIAFYNEDVTFIDVPGHEKFIKNMVTGVSTVDAALLVIAADDGVMPQTREHLDILHILGVKRLLVALNKSDLVEPDWLSLVSEEVDTFLKERDYPETSIVPVSATTGQGIEDLRTALDQLIDSIQAQDRHGIFRLPIDRVFSVKGFGTVVTGTVLSHELRKGQNVELFPQQIVYPVRGLQSHNQDVDKIRFGDRGAINLAGASVDELGRGAFLATPGLFQTGSSWIGLLQVLPHWKKAVKEADRVHIHVGTGKREARIHLLEANRCEPGESMLAQFFFEESISAGFKEMVVIRFLSPEETLGGAVLLWAMDRRLKKMDKRLSLLKEISNKNIEQLICIALDFFMRPFTRREIARLLSVSESKVQAQLQKSETINTYQDNYINKTTFEEILSEIRATLTTYHQEQPLGKGLTRENLTGAPAELRDFVLNASLAVGELKNQGNLWQLAGHQGELDEADQSIKAKIVEIYTAQAFSPPSVSDLNKNLDEASQTVHKWMIQHGELIRIEKDYYILSDQMDYFQAKLRSWFTSNTELSISQLREIIPSTRKYLLPILNYCERKGLLIRDGDVRRWVGEELKK